MLNTVALQGRLTYDPELKTTTNGTSVVHFQIACGRNYGDRSADFFRITAFSKTADFVSRYFKKGDMILLSGELHSNDYNDKNGNRRTSVEVVANQVNFAGGKDEADTAGATAAPAGNRSAAPKTEIAGTEVLEDDDLPF